MAVKIKWNRSAFEQIRRMPGVDAAIQTEVSSVLAQVGDGYAGGVERGATRSRGFVVTTTGDAIRENAEEHTLLRALGGGR